MAWKGLLGGDALGQRVLSGLSPVSAAGLSSATGSDRDRQGKRGGQG